ncbi:hypothetical protein [Aquimarina sp. AU119]|uniref:hypothetical protein n=1 Tax=Aquimarina sp. AU119 TaxID=2108528 RepID=UPI000D693C19|nr:hypothetical protein [Aquimarina sp. AU119]
MDNSNKIFKKFVEVLRNFGITSKQFNQNVKNFQYEKDLYHLSTVTNIEDVEELLKKLAPLQMVMEQVFKFYCATGRFPNKEEDEFIYQYGFNNWHSLHIKSIQGYKTGKLLYKTIKKS